MWTRTGSIWNGTAQYSANIVAIMLITISLGISFVSSPKKAKISLQLGLVGGCGINKDVFRLSRDDLGVYMNQHSPG